MRYSLAVATAVAIFSLGSVSVAFSASPIKVDRSNYQEAEVARNFTKWAANGANNKLMHMTAVTPSGPAPTVRMNRDTLYSGAFQASCRLKLKIMPPYLRSSLSFAFPG
jgi:hypothetical protein